MSVTQQPPTLPDLDEATNILLLGSESPVGHSPEVACSELLSRRPTESTDVLSITFTESPDERIDHWTCHVGSDLPAKMGFVSVDDQSRSVVAESGDCVELPGTCSENIRIETVSDPGDLTGIGVAVTKFLGDWEKDDHDISLCLHSLTTLLQYAELNPTYKFLHTLTGHVRQYGAVAHYHLDPSVHEERAVDLLTTLMDAVVEVTDEGDYVVTSQY